MPIPFRPRKHRLHPVLNDPIEVEDAKEVPTGFAEQAAAAPAAVPDPAPPAATEAPSVIQRLRRVSITGRRESSPAPADPSSGALPAGSTAEQPEPTPSASRKSPPAQPVGNAHGMTDAMSEPRAEDFEAEPVESRPGLFKRWAGKLFARRSSKPGDDALSQVHEPTAVPLSAFLERDEVPAPAPAPAPAVEPAMATPQAPVAAEAPAARSEAPAQAEAPSMPPERKRSKRASSQARHDPGAPSSLVPVDAADKPDFAATEMAGVEEALIGEILAKANDLDREQVQAILEYQAANDCKFGEAAVALRLVKVGDVMWALSRQYQYAVSPDDDATSRHLAKLDDELVVAKHPYSDAAEMVRDIRSQLLESVLHPDLMPKMAVAVTSPNVGDGKSWLAANLALSLSQLGSRTLLIDADLRAPRLHRVFGLDDRVPGLSAMLAGRTRPNVLRPIKSMRTLYLLPGGITPPNPLELIQGRLFSLLMKQLLVKFDHVIVDTPAAEHGADCRVIAGQCGAALIVGRRNNSSMAQLQALSSKLTRGQTQIAGLVMNSI